MRIRCNEIDIGVNADIVGSDRSGEYTTGYIIQDQGVADKVFK